MGGGTSVDKWTEVIVLIFYYAASKLFEPQESQSSETIWRVLSYL